jgi:hypothetical protein
MQVTGVREQGENLRGVLFGYKNIETSLLYTRNFVVPDLCMLLDFFPSIVNLFDMFTVFSFHFS